MCHYSCKSVLQTVQGKKLSWNPSDFLTSWGEIWNRNQQILVAGWNELKWCVPTIWYNIYMWLFDQFLCVCGPVIAVLGTERICFVEADQWKNSWFLCRVIFGPVSAWYQTSVSHMMYYITVHSAGHPLCFTHCLCWTTIHSCWQAVHALRSQLTLFFWSFQFHNQSFKTELPITIGCPTPHLLNGTY